MRQLSINNYKRDVITIHKEQVSKISILKIAQFIMFLLMILANVIAYFMNNDLLFTLAPATFIVLILLLAKNLEFNTSYQKSKK